ncbi:hypothetical protein C7433_102512 [Pantoea sp. PNA 03-3]|nr:hypothetical protein C7433_102512 [Pantoea sp. PNA 03-3]
MSQSSLKTDTAGDFAHYFNNTHQFSQQETLGR